MRKERGEGEGKGRGGVKKQTGREEGRRELHDVMERWRQIGREKRKGGREGWSRINL